MCKIIILLILALFANFKAKRGRNGWKKLNPIYIHCTLYTVYSMFWLRADGYILLFSRDSIKANIVTHFFYVRLPDCIDVAVCGIFVCRAGRLVVTITDDRLHIGLNPDMRFRLFLVSHCCLQCRVKWFQQNWWRPNVNITCYSRCVLLLKFTKLWHDSSICIWDITKYTHQKQEVRFRLFHFLLK